MKIITIKNNKIIEKKEVSSHYVMCESDVLDDGTYGEVGQVLINGAWQKDPIVIAEQANQQRIAELKQIIDNKNYLGDDVTEERAELRTLLGM